ncbi:hypothetical protein Droror1_Dr00005459 [Drosera rotundifolia]
MRFISVEYFISVTSTTRQDRADNRRPTTAPKPPASPSLIAVDRIPTKPTKKETAKARSNEPKSALKKNEPKSSRDSDANKNATTTTITTTAAAAPQSLSKSNGQILISFHNFSSLNYLFDFETLI